jgi:hypothetical protein
MSINPVPVVSSITEAQAATANGRARGQASRASTQPTSEPDPKQEANTSPNNNLVSQLPQDEVELQRDSQADGAIVVRYMDHAGNLILQVPSEQVLNVTQSIDQDLKREEEVRAKAETAALAYEGGKTDGH